MSVRRGRPSLFLVVCGAGALLAGGSMLFAPTVPLRWALGAFALSFAALGVGWWLIERGTAQSPDGVWIGGVERGGVRQPAFVFSFAWGRQAVIGLLALLLLPPLVLFAFFAEDLGFRNPALLRALALIGLFLLAVLEVVIVALSIMLRSGRAYLALLPDGILHRSRLSSSFVPWDTIERVGPFARRSGRYVGVRVRDPDRVEMWGRRLFGFNRRISGYDFGFSLRMLRVPPDLAIGAFARYVDSPEKRAEIGTEGELAAVRAGT